MCSTQVTTNIATNGKGRYCLSSRSEECAVENFIDFEHPQAQTSYGNTIIRTNGLPMYLARQYRRTLLGGKKPLNGANTLYEMVSKTKVCCKPEDVERTPRRRHDDDTICSSCKLPVCNECWSLTMRKQAIPKALTNDNYIGYINKYFVEKQCYVVRSYYRIHCFQWSRDILCRRPTRG